MASEQKEFSVLKRTSDAFLKRKALGDLSKSTINAMTGGDSERATGDPQFEQWSAKKLGHASRMNLPSKRPSKGTLTHFALPIDES